MRRLLRLSDKIKNNKGFTLVELVVVIAIMAILIVMVSSLIFPVSDAVNRNRRASEADTAMETIHSFIQKSIKSSNHVTIKYVDPTGTGGIDDNPVGLTAMKNFTMLKESAADTDFYTLATAEISGTEIVTEEIRAFRLKWTTRSDNTQGYVLEHLFVNNSAAAGFNRGKLIFDTTTGDFKAERVFYDVVLGKVYYDFSIESTVRDVIEIGITPYLQPDLAADSLIRTASNNTFEFLNIRENGGSGGIAWYNLNIPASIPTLTSGKPDIYFYYLANLNVD